MRKLAYLSIVVVALVLGSFLFFYSIIISNQPSVSNPSISPDVFQENNNYAEATSSVSGISEQKENVPITSLEQLSLNSNKSKFSQVIIDKRVYNVEVASTPEEREIGLMNRDHLDSNTGMIFVFQDISEVSFWNENTLISLDIIWILNNKVKGISSLRSIGGGPLTVFSPTPVQYVLEIPAGTALRNGIHIGSIVEFKL
ncbi:MAG: DUF192 domain-containing protein [bacterium]|nr:DUF192 domain-containing protein [bacterium]